MSPEQAAGQAAAVGPASDVFGLGAILYQLLTGRPPYQGTDVRTTLRQAEQGEVVPVRQLNPAVPAALARVCDRALAADRKARYPTARALESDLRRYLDWGRRLAVRGGIASGALLVLLSVGLALSGALDPAGQRGGLPSPAGPDGVRALPLPPTTEPLTNGELIVRIGSMDPVTRKTIKDFIPVERPGALPARTGDIIQLEVKLNRPGYAYLVWLDSEKVQALYPWDHEKQQISEPAPAQAPRAHFLHPQNAAEGWPLDDTEGMETVILLARSTPLPADIDLGKLLRPLARPAYQDEREVVVRGTNKGQAIPEVNQFRGLGKKSKAIDSPVARLIDAVAPHFEVVRVVRFAHKK
jgi:hypothetical protein